MFKSARIKLTGWYILILMIITVGFSSIVYFRVVRNTRLALIRHEQRFERCMNMPSSFQPLDSGPRNVITEEILREVKLNTLTLLAVINSLILAVAGGLSYWLAGRTLRPIQQMMDKQKDFVANAAHDLKTPLTSIKTQLEVALRTDKLKLPEAKGVMRSTLEDVDSLALLTRKLLTESKYSNNKKLQNVKEIDFNSLVKKVIEELNPGIKDKKLKVSLEIDDSEFKANKSQITQLMRILIDNAVKFNKASGFIKIKSYKKGDSFYIEVSDNGVGISSEDIDKVFDRFYKVDESRTKVENDGFGLGLSIAKEIVKIHKGTITVQSNLDQGTSLKIKLPQNP